MFRPLRKSSAVAGGLVGCLALLVAAPLAAQNSPQMTKADAALVVDGTVRQIFSGGEQRRSDYLVEIEVRRAEARQTAPGSARSHFPAPTESVYVHVSQPAEAVGRLGLGDSQKRIPTEGQSIRAYLKPRAAGGWQDALADWYEAGGDNAGNVATDEPAKKPESQTLLGMTVESLRIEKRTVLRVASVVRGGPAQSAGLEVGDVIAGVNGEEISKGDELTALAALGEKFTLLVVDVNSGRAARVEIDPGSKSTGAPPANAPTADTRPTPASPTVSLGLSAESVTLGTRSALKVTRVDPAGVAAKAGLEPGDIVVAANGTPTTSAEQLLSALRKSGPTLKLTVRDSRTGRDTDVDVALGAAKPTAPKEAESPITRTPGKLGAVTELAFHDNEFAVKVTEITPGSAAARAGLKPGVLIVAAGGKPVLHPNDLNDLVRGSPGTLKLTVVDPASGAKSNIEVKLP